MLGAHALMHKGNPYEESIRVPMVITGGDSLHLKTPGKIQEWVTNLDLMPTILELAGIKIPENTEGLSLVPLLTSDSITNFRESFVMEYLGPGMAVAKFADHPKWIMKRLPLYILDHPSYNAIRMKTGTAGSGEKTEKVYKYIEWQRYWDKKTLRFSDQYRLKDPRLMAKLRSGNKKAWRLKARSEEVETELYDLTVDPYEMDNLLYYKPEEYRDLAATLKDAMRSIILKNDPKNK
jgi:arylsulfatase A-like enzyme